MDREALLLRSFKVLNNNPRKDPEALQILIMKLLQINHKLGLRCWEECLTTNIEEIKKDLEYEDPRSQKPDWWEQEDDDDDWDETEDDWDEEAEWDEDSEANTPKPPLNSFKRHSLGWYIVWKIEEQACEGEWFGNAFLDFGKNKKLLNIIDTQLPVSFAFRAYYPVGYLLRCSHYKEAENVLTALYKNENFHYYSELWSKVTCDRHFTGSHFPEHAYDDKFILNKKMIEFCFTWIERIPDEEEQAASVAYAMELCEENKNFADM